MPGVAERDDLIQPVEFLVHVGVLRSRDRPPGGIRGDGCECYHSRMDALLASARVRWRRGRVSCEAVVLPRRSSSTRWTSASDLTGTTYRGFCFCSLVLTSV